MWDHCPQEHDEHRERSGQVRAIRDEIERRVGELPL